MKRRNFLGALLALPFLRFRPVAPQTVATAVLTVDGKVLARRVIEHQQDTAADLATLSLRLTEQQAIADAKRGPWANSKHRL